MQAGIISLNAFADNSFCGDFVVETAVRVDIPLDMELLKNFKIIQSVSKPGLSNEFVEKANKKAEEYINRIKDIRVRNYIGDFYAVLAKYCDITPLNTLDCTNLDKAISKFQGFLKNKTGYEYQIRLIANGNI